MYPSTQTLTEQFAQLIEQNSPKVTEVIGELIKHHDTKEMIMGEKYYENLPDILNRTQYYYDEEGAQYIDSTKPNNRVAHNFHKVLVDQKVGYLVGNPVAMTALNETFTKELNSLFADTFDDDMPELVKEASNKGKAWHQVFINEDGAFDYLMIPSEQIIPIYNPRDNRKLEAVIRYYAIDERLAKIEVWDEQTVTYYERTADGDVSLDVSYEENPASHFKQGNKGYGWGKVPFIEYQNNSECINDLRSYKTLVDAYNLVVSDTQNNIEEVASLVTVLKGYDGESLTEFMNNLRFFKSIKVSEDGGVDVLKQEIPTQAIKEQLERLEADIFTFGQGVNPKTDNFGGNATGVALKFLYSMLDMKANIMERKFKKALRNLVWFACEYMTMSGKGKYNYKEVEFTFNKSMIFNDVEMVQLLQNSVGLISNETIIANHPFVDDVSEEQKRIEKEQSAYSNTPII